MMEKKDRPAEIRKLIQFLRDPFKLRATMTAIMVLVGYVAIYEPLNERIELKRRQLAQERGRQKAIADVEFLRAQVDMFHARLPINTDTNEWVQYVLEGIRQFPVKLVNLDSEKSRRVGPYEAIAMRIELEGDFHDLDSFLHWVETNDRLFRVDSATIEPSRQLVNARVMNITLLGLKA